MSYFFRTRPASMAMVVIVLAGAMLLQSGVSYTLSFGPLDAFAPSGLKQQSLAGAWLALRVALIALLIVLWALGRKRLLFKFMIVANAVFTFGLALNVVSLTDVLLRFSGKTVWPLLTDVVLIASTNVLIFSVWYWVIDPPGVEETQRDDSPWEFLFPQRASSLPRYETWSPRYTDYLYLAFTTSVAFSAADTLPLTRRAKLLMALQAMISLITLTVIVGNVINLVVGSG
jgi:hypothetical protein